MVPLILGNSHIGIMEKNVETTVQGLDFWILWLCEILNLGLGCEGPWVYELYRGLL